MNQSHSGFIRTSPHWRRLVHAPRRAARAGWLVPRSRFQSVRVAPPCAQGTALSTVIWMVRPERWVVTPYSALPLRLSMIHGPDELFKVIPRPLATTTPESLVFLPAISPLPRPV